ncbi:hypothetical protein ACFL54_08760 [Planctomycetota bacterium]
MMLFKLLKFYLFIIGILIALPFTLSRSSDDEGQTIHLNEPLDNRTDELFDDSMAPPCSFWAWPYIENSFFYNPFVWGDNHLKEINLSLPDSPHDSPKLEYRITFEWDKNKVHVKIFRYGCNNIEPFMIEEDIYDQKTTHIIERHLYDETNGECNMFWSYDKRMLIGFQANWEFMTGVKSDGVVSEMIDSTVTRQHWIDNISTKYYSQDKTQVNPEQTNIVYQRSYIENAQNIQVCQTNSADKNNKTYGIFNKSGQPLKYWSDRSGSIIITHVFSNSGHLIRKRMYHPEGNNIKAWEYSWSKKGELIEWRFNGIFPDKYEREFVMKFIYENNIVKKGVNYCIVDGDVINLENGSAVFEYYD